MFVDGVNSHVSFLRDLSRQINGLRATSRPKKIPSSSSFQEPHFRQTPQQLEETPSAAQYEHGQNREHVIDTFASIPCLSCAQVDEEAGLVCETCDRVQHLKCMSTSRHVPKECKDARCIPRRVEYARRRRICARWDSRMKGCLTRS